MIAEVAWIISDYSVWFEAHLALLEGFGGLALICAGPDLREDAE